VADGEKAADVVVFDAIMSEAFCSILQLSLI
jgi:hypothetical protein